VERRSDKRLEANFPVRIQGADARGVNFDEPVRTINVSEQGMALLTQRDLPRSAILTVSIPGRGATRPRGGRADFLAQAIVAYVLPEGDLNRVGLRFICATLAL
jgi:hypothetical protein